MLLVHVTNLGADFLVKGSYGDPRLLEYWFGGATYDLLNRATVPVLMSH